MNINKIFHFEEKGKLPEKCVMCEDILAEYEQGYIIEKAFIRNEQTEKYEIEFEYAICFECAERMSLEMSKESREKIQKYIRENENNNLKNSKLEYDVIKRTSTCMISGENVQKSKEYQIGAYFLKKEMIISDIFPYAIGETAIEQIQELISDKTRDFSDKFKNLILPPQIRDKFPKDRIVFF